MMVLPIGLTVVFGALLVWTELRSSDSPLKWVFKPLASLGFVALGVGAIQAAGADHAMAAPLLAALLLCLLGDVLLIPKHKRAFLLGLVSFLLGHVGYAVAFATGGLDLAVLAVAGGAVLLLGVGVLRWLWPHVDARMRGPVLAYVLVISTMVAVSCAAVPVGLSPWVLAGVVLFFVSDLFVARNRFVAPGSVNRLFGLPLYYGGQLLIAGFAL